MSFFSQITFTDKLLFTKHLSIMLKSGITVAESLAILRDQSKSSSMKKVLTGVYHAIQNGHSLSSALGKYPHVFNKFYLSIIIIGEESGTLDVNLDYLSAQLVKESEFKQAVRGALLYPAFVLGTAVVIGTGISVFILPRLLGLFSGFGLHLPLATQILIGFANLTSRYGLWIVVLIIVLVVLMQPFSRSKRGAALWDSLILSVPIFGTMFQHIALCSFTRNIGVMIKSGLTLTTALEIESMSNESTVFRKYSKNLLASLTQGHSLTQELTRNHYRYIPSLAEKMIEVGESSGKIEETLLYLGDYFETEVYATMKNLSVILEPLLLLFVGAIVLFIAVAIISPMYQLTGGLTH